MNKLVKGAIAGAAGIVLLMGGAGSLAYWNDSAQAGPASGSITAGTLSILPVNSGAWTKGLYNNAGTQTVAPAAVANLAAVRVVPGNRLVYTQAFNLSATGDDLFFTIGSTTGSVLAASVGAADTQLASVINGSPTTAFTVGSVTGGNVVASGVTAGVYKLNAAAGPSTITVTWTINIPFGAAVDNVSKGGIVTLTQGAITVTQVAAP